MKADIIGKITKRDLKSIHGSSVMLSSVLDMKISLNESIALLSHWSDL